MPAFIISYDPVSERGCSHSTLCMNIMSKQKAYTSSAYPLDLFIYNSPVIDIVWLSDRQEILSILSQMRPFLKLKGFQI